MNDKGYGIQLQEKFEVYLLGLVFTVLALAVQTAKFDNVNIVAACLELASWVALLISGLVGLWRMEWIPVAHIEHAGQLQSEADLRQFRDLAEQGVDSLPLEGQEESAPIEALIKDREQHILRMKAKDLKHQTATRKKYNVHKWSFVLGMTLLIGARGVGPAIRVYQAVMKAPSTADSVPRNAGGGTGR